MSDNELDAELLALAGGDDSGSENEEQLPTKQSKSPSPSPARSPPVKVVKARPAKAQKGVAQRKNAKATRTTKPKTKDDSDAAEQASSAESAPISLGSGAMSESEDDRPPMKSDDGPLFPVDGKFYSEKDRAEILGMSEIKREEILADRAQLLERQTQDQHLRRLLQAREKDTADRKKRKGGDAELEESPRKGTRQKVKAAENLEAYKRQRERRNDQRKQEEDRRNRDRDSPSQENGLSEGEADAESEVEWDDTTTKAPATRDEPASAIADFECLRIGRSDFAKICFCPGFEDTIKGCFSRVNIGPEKATGQNKYRMVQIKGFTTGRPYAMEGSNGKPFHTDQYAIVAHGKAEKEWPFLACSNARFTESELERYKRAVANDNLRLPTMSMIYARKGACEKLLDHVWTNEEINAKLTRSGVLAAKHATFDRARLTQYRNRAVEKGNEADIANIDQQLAALDGPKLAFGTSLSSSAAKPQILKTATDQERIAAINKANRQAYTESLRKAQLAEKRAEREAQDKIARGEATANPFARVKTRAKVHHDAPDSNGLQVPSSKALDDLFGEGSDVSQAATPKPGTGTGNGTSTPKTSKPSTQPTGIPSFRKRNMDDEGLSEIDLGIDIDI